MEIHRMERKFWKVAGASLLACSMTTIAPAMAQTSQSGQSDSAQSESASAGQSTPSAFEQRGDANDKDWGWLGLLGLLGLAGLRRRRDADLHRTATDANRSHGAYNR
jgi:MYXO-CTERM domain-containing protein